MCRGTHFCKTDIKPAFFRIIIGWASLLYWIGALSEHIKFRKSCNARSDMQSLFTNSAGFPVHLELIKKSILSNLLK